MPAHRTRRAPNGWVPPGPPSLADARLQADADEDLNYLTGDWRIFQKRRGHRWSLDDLVTADFAINAVAGANVEPRSVVDLGCGIGSVLLMLAWRFPGSTCVGVEAQDLSAALAEKSIAFNGVGARVRVVRGDLRATPLPSAALVTGTPPYFPIGTGSAPARAQAEGALFELRGGPEAYIAASARILEPDGRFVFCTSLKQHARVPVALARAGLFLRTFQRVIPREGKSPLICLWAASNGPGEAIERSDLVVRDATGQWTEAFKAVRVRMGLPLREP